MNMSLHIFSLISYDETCIILVFFNLLHKSSLLHSSHRAKIHHWLQQGVKWNNCQFDPLYWLKDLVHWKTYHLYQWMENLWILDYFPRINPLMKMNVAARYNVARLCFTASFFGKCGGSGFCSRSLNVMSLGELEAGRGNWLAK